jgi:HK97 family phage portal protein
VSIINRFTRWLMETPQDSGAMLPRAAITSAGGGLVITSSSELEEALRGGAVSGAGEAVNAQTAMRVAAVYACVRIIAGAVATLPLQIKRRVNDGVREDASDLAISQVLNRKPNRWQKPAQFKRMMQAHVLLRGQAFALISRDAFGSVVALIPLHPDRVAVKQLDTLDLEYRYTRKDGQLLTFTQTEVLHLIGLTLDGINGVSPITYARETIGLALAMERHGGAVFRNGANVSTALKHPGKLSPEAHAVLRDGMSEFRNGGAREGETIILEEGMSLERMALTAEDAQWIEGRKFSRSDIAMFFGVPPHMIGDTEKATSWGSGIEQQSQGFVTYTLEDHLTMWEETINLDCLDPIRNPGVYAKFNRNALVKGDLKSRWEAYVKAMQWGVFSPNKVLELEDENPRPGGDVYYDPPNMAGGSQGNSVNEPA